MLHSHTIFTAELDIPEVAVHDILQQMAALTLCKHTVGILVCHYDHIESGIVAALQEALPFPLIGSTTFYQMTPRTGGLFSLTITILTSDDVRFAMAYSTVEECHGSVQQQIFDTYRRAFAIYGERPSLICSFLSTNRPISGDEYLRQLDAASGGIPSFGVVDSSDDESGENIYILCEGRPFFCGFALLLLIGDIHAGMYVNDTAEKGLLSVTTTVTRADGVSVRELNGQPAAEYLAKNGVTLNIEGAGSLAVIPFYCRMPGGDTLIGRTLRTIHADGSLEFMAEIPVGTLLRVGTTSADDIMEESRATMERAVAENSEAALFLIGSCVGRFITLGMDTTAELDYALQAIPAHKPYLACYVGGEICPILIHGKLTNQYHNNSFIVLALH